MEKKNVFDYLEYSFKSIFCKNGLILLRSSFIVGMVSLFFSIILVSSIFYFIYSVTLDVLNIVSYLYIFLSFILLLGVGFLESSYYAVVIPTKLQNQISETSLYQDYVEWKKYFGRYFLYITYLSTVLLLLVLTLILGGIVAYSTLDLGVVFYIFMAIWIYIYVMYRLVVSWYCILFENANVWELFLKGWNLLGGKVYTTFKNVIIFSFIVGLAASTSSYLAQLFIPDFSYILLEITSKINSLKGTQPTLEEIIPFIKDITASVLTPGIYALIIFSIFYKLGFVLQTAMIHSFLAKYYYDINGKENSSQES